MANKNIFCNVPWYELHIYWDGSLGICCLEDHKLHTDSARYNIANMTIAEWFNSPPVQQFREQITSDTPVTACRVCYHEEAQGGISRRIRNNQKSVIFTQAFDDSFKQSPGHRHFVSPITIRQPIDIHINLGNYCNLACKMCQPEASSNIASQYVEWGIHTDAVGVDWTRDDAVWTRFCNELAAIPKLNNIHFMGGETLITKRFEEFVDFMIAQNRTDVRFSFVTNGTTFNETLINKLKKFQQVGIEISIETITPHNSYVRQGTNTEQVLANINRYLEHCNGTNITLTIRPAISALTIGNYHTLLKFCLEKHLSVRSLLVTKPDYLNVNVLPEQVKQQYLTNYQQMLEQTTVDADIADYNQSDPGKYAQNIRQQINTCINLLQQPAGENQEQLLDNLVTWCRKWDNVYNYNALELYPELAKEFQTRGY